MDARRADALVSAVPAEPAGDRLGARSAVVATVHVTVPAERRCDLDHVVRWPEGATVAGNLAALCRHHHRLKHRTRWAVRAGPGGELEWTAPTGHRHRTSPAPE